MNAVAASPAILLVTRNFPPLWGGMERLNWHLAQELSRRDGVHVIAPRGAAALAPAGVSISEVPLNPLPRFLFAAAYVARREARRRKPAVVLAGSGLTAPIALLAARVCGAQAAAYVHGLDLAIAHPVYRALWLPAIRKMDGVIANSRATAAQAETIGVNQDRIRIVPPGVELPKETPEQRYVLRQEFRIARKLEGRKILITVGRLTQRKGVSAFVREALPAIVRACPDAVLLVIGAAPQAALAAQPDPPEAILAAAREVGMAEHVRYLGPLFGDELKAAWYAADVHVFPVRHNPSDPEGFGMVAIEAAAHGLPTVAYATGGVVDAVKEGISGWLIRPGDVAGFITAVLDVLQAPMAEAGIRAFAEAFAWDRFGAGMDAVLLWNRSV